MRCPIRCTFGIASLAVAASTASGQRMSLSAAQGFSGHRLLSDPRGPSVSVTWPLDDHFAVRTGVHVLGLRQTQIGRACGGFVDPTTCAQEEVHDRTTLAGVVVGLVAAIVRRDQVTLSVMPTVNIAGARTSSRGRETGNVLDASTEMHGIGVGAELSFFPRSRWPVGLHLGAHFVRLTSDERLAIERYWPFSEPIDLTRLELGLSLRTPRASPVRATR